MSGELTRWIASTPAEREHDRALTRVENTTDVALARINAITGVTQGAIVGALCIETTKQAAELACPGGAATFHLLTMAGVSNLAMVVQGFDGRRS